MVHEWKPLLPERKYQGFYFQRTDPGVKKVTAAVIQRQGKILIAQRKKGVPLGGKWEFPGGKIEPGETPEECLARELFEEFGITAVVGEFFCRSTNDDPSRPIELITYHVSHVGGDFILSDHQRIAWVSPEELADYDYPYADLAIVKKLVDNLTPNQ